MSDLDDATRDIAEVPAAELITTVAVHLMSAAAVKLGLAEGGERDLDLDEARKLVDSTPARCATGCAACSSPSARHPRSPTRRARAPARSGRGRFPEPVLLSRAVCQVRLGVLSPCVRDPSRRRG
jgi:hypothetical protein